MFMCLKKSGVDEGSTVFDRLSEEILHVSQKERKKLSTIHK